MITVIFALYRDFWPLPWYRVTAVNIDVLYAISVFKISLLSKFCSTFPFQSCTGYAHGQLINFAGSIPSRPTYQALIADISLRKLQPTSRPSEWLGCPTTDILVCKQRTFPTTLWPRCTLLVCSYWALCKPVHGSQCSTAAELQWHELGSASNGSIQC